MLHDMIEHFFVIGSPLYARDLIFRTISGTDTEAVVRRVALSIMKDFRVAERSSPEVEQLVMIMLDNFGEMLNNAIRAAGSYVFVDYYVTLGVNSFMSRKGISTNTGESVKDAIALCELTQRPRPIFLTPDELSKENIQYLTRIMFGRKRNDDHGAYYAQAVKNALAGFNAPKLSECLRDIFDVLFLFMYGAVFCVSNPNRGYVPADLPDIDLK
jgi:hypothetical protein